MHFEWIDYLYIFEIFTFAMVIIALTAIYEWTQRPTFQRWLEYRQLRKQLRRGRTTKEIKAMRRVMS